MVSPSHFLYLLFFPLKYEFSSLDFQNSDPEKLQDIIDIRTSSPSYHSCQSSSNTDPLDQVPLSWCFKIPLLNVTTITLVERKNQTMYLVLTLPSALILDNTFHHLYFVLPQLEKAMNLTISRSVGYLSILKVKLCNDPLHEYAIVYRQPLKSDSTFLSIHFLLRSLNIIM